MKRKAPSKSTRPYREVVVADSTSLQSLFSLMSGTLRGLRMNESFDEYVSRYEQIIQDNVNQISALIRGHDAFDVIEVMRQNERPWNLDHFKESEADGLPAVLDLVAAILAASGRRRGDRYQSTEPFPPSAQEVAELARECFSLSHFADLNVASSLPYGPLSEFAAIFKNTNVVIRGRRYADIGDEIDGAIFSSPSIQVILQAQLGFSFEQYREVRAAQQARYAAGLARIAAQADFTILGDGPSPSPGSPELQFFDDLCIFPGQRASFGVDELEKETGLPRDAIKAILTRFSEPFEPADPVSAAKDVLAGSGAFPRASLLRDSNERYISLGHGIGNDYFRFSVEESLKASKSWNRYERQRGKAAERMAISLLERLLQVSATATSLEYFAPGANQVPSDLGSGAAVKSLSKSSKRTEADALFLVGDVAVCVEVKAGSISEPARSGNVLKLTRDLDKTIGDATSQANRLRDLLITNGGLWLVDGSWLDTGQVREVLSVAVCLDDVGSVGVALDHLVRAKIVSGNYPWIVSLHDLHVVALILNRPAEFLLYLRRRTDAESATRFEAPEELDLLMYFVDGGLYFPPNPERIANNYPSLGPARAAAKAAYAREPAVRRIHTYTDELDAWMYFSEGSSSVEVAKPARATNSFIQELTDYIESQKKNGWLSSSADLLNLSSEAQKELAAAAAKVAKQTARDDQRHSAAVVAPESWGLVVAAVITKPLSRTMPECTRHAKEYLDLKKHQVGADRSIGVLIDRDGSILWTYYNSDPYQASEEMDRRAARYLQPPFTVPVPPSARRSSKRLRKRKH
ncbi:hypothetical protein [Rathayibacter sp. AY1C1]|uniref:hypothetical protein n=1 Tax=Rathayibacter sp. AY1C1 TaxID=2080534 RepID=UPI0011B0F3F8|nr:hypothetical protein [Rathayibacter sp. AY1C1]